MFVVAVVLYVLERTGSASLAGATVACATFPSLVTGPLLGAWFDRARRRFQVAALDQLVAAISLVAILAVAGNGPDWLLIAIAIASGVTLPLSGGGFTSLIPALVPADLLPRANALEAASFNAATVAGPALAAAIAGLWSPAGAILSEIGLYVVALGLVAGLSEPGREPPPPSGVGAAVAAGLRHLARTPELLAATVAGSLALLGRGLLVIAFPLFAATTLDASRSAGGYLWAAFALGSMLGALGLARLQTAELAGRTVLLATATSGAIILTWPLASSLPVGLILIGAAGFAYGPGLVATFSVRQLQTPPHLWGQVFMTAASLKTASFSAGAALAAVASRELGASGALLAYAGIQLLGALLGLLIRGGVVGPPRSSSGPSRKV